MIVESAAESDGTRIVADLAVEAGGSVPGGEHVHDHLAEHVEVRAGRVTFVLDSGERTLAAGEQLTVVPGTWHRWWNAGQDEVQVRVRIEPAMRFEEAISSSGDCAPMGTRRPRGLLAAVRCAACRPLSPGAPLSAAARCRSKAPVPAARRARAATRPGAHRRSLPRSRDAPRRRIGARSPPGAGDAADRRASVSRARCTGVPRFRLARRMTVKFCGLLGRSLRWFPAGAVGALARGWRPSCPVGRPLSGRLCGRCRLVVSPCMGESEVRAWN
jgi:mannose-6-phosphate isomerase-like protein (cupin superfamily)